MNPVWPTVPLLPRYSRDPRARAREKRAEAYRLDARAALLRAEAETDLAAAEAIARDTPHGDPTTAVMTPTGKLFVSGREAAKMIGRDAAIVYSACESGELAGAVRLTHGWRIPVASLVGFHGAEPARRPLRAKRERRA